MADHSGPIERPPGPPPGELSHEDGGPRLAATAWVLWVLCTIFLVLRVYCKHVGRRGLWWDDHVLLASWVVFFADVIVTTELVKLGFGKHMWDFNMDNLGPAVKLLVPRGTLSLVAIAWTKTAFAISLLRVTSGWMKGLVWFILVTVNVALGLSALFPWIQCTPIQGAWDITVERTCWDPDIILKTHTVSGAYSAAMDFVLALLPWSVLWNLQMKRKEKIGAGVAMSLGIFAGATGVVKTAMLPNLFTNDMYDGVNLMVWDMAEAAVTMIATCIPVLRVLIKERRSSAAKYYLSGEGSRAGAGTGHGAGPFKSRATQRGVSVFDRTSFQSSAEKITDRGESHDEFELVSRGNSGPC